MGSRARMWFSDFYSSLLFKEVVALSRLSVSLVLNLWKMERGNTNVLKKRVLAQRIS